MKDTIDLEYGIDEIVGEACRSAYEQGKFEGMSESEYNQFVADLKITGRRAALEGDYEAARAAVESAIESHVA